ncbi:hypothetical protein [Bradyrhizobium tunisiense]|uniref:hypothetical protein n=1 Tax=Bradyrhizobium tunisiense TaxID=3278709 RepID=UPI0035E053BF
MRVVEVFYSDSRNERGKDMLHRLGLDDRAEVDLPGRLKARHGPRNAFAAFWLKASRPASTAEKERESGQSASLLRLRRRAPDRQVRPSNLPEIVGRNAAAATTAARHSWSRSTRLDERLRASQRMTPTGEQDR